MSIQQKTNINYNIWYFLYNFLLTNVEWKEAIWGGESV